MIVEALSFQNINKICSYYKLLDPNLDLAAILKKPYKKRKRKLIEELAHLVEKRHEFIHRAKSDIEFSDRKIEKIISDLCESILRCYKLITDTYGWTSSDFYMASR